MLVSTNCTVVYLVTAQSVGGAELADFRLDLVLKRLKPCELVHSSGQALQVRNDQCAQGGVTLRGGDPGVAVDLVGNGDRNIFHSLTVTQILWKSGLCEPTAQGNELDRHRAYSCDFSPSIAGLVWGPMASSWLCTTTHRPAISRQTLVFLIRVNSVPEVVAKVTSK